MLSCSTPCVPVRTVPVAPGAPCRHVPYPLATSSASPSWVSAPSRSPLLPQHARDGDLDLDTAMRMAAKVKVRLEGDAYVRFLQLLALHTRGAESGGGGKGGDNQDAQGVKLGVADEAAGEAEEFAAAAAIRELLAPHPDLARAFDRFVPDASLHLAGEPACCQRRLSWDGCF